MQKVIQYNFPPLGMVHSEEETGEYEFSFKRKISIGKKHIFFGDLDMWHTPSLDLYIYDGMGNAMKQRALIDTGAYYNAVNQRVFGEKMPKIQGYIFYSSPTNGRYRMPIFRLDFGFESVPFKFIDAFTLHHSDFEYDIIIGTKFLKEHELHIIGKEGRFELHLL